LIGLIFVEGRSRYVQPSLAASIAANARDAGRPLLVTGVFDARPDESFRGFAERVNRIADLTGLDLIQIHRLPEGCTLDALERPVLLALSPGPGEGGGALASTMARYARSSAPPIGFTIDGHAPDRVGGTGVPADWRLVRRLGAQWPVVLAGGLTPDNVVSAVHAAAPLAVDVSGGVETDGVKDREKIERFVTNAKRAFAEAQTAKFESTDSPVEERSATR
jgi:phosphoribosylanthranilate isomerase